MSRLADLSSSTLAGAQCCCFVPKQGRLPDQHHDQNKPLEQTEASRNRTLCPLKPRLNWWHEKTNKKNKHKMGWFIVAELKEEQTHNWTSYALEIFCNRQQTLISKEETRLMDRKTKLTAMGWSMTLSICVSRLKKKKQQLLNSNLTDWQLQPTVIKCFWIETTGHVKLKNTSEKLHRKKMCKCDLDDNG